ncbi:hypothetical protein QFC22_003105 [Naganishia vaughanmartiniae]|uniref:Uncharacterized protein n=1 Tax=Naganishia vaughanmartiniae TaxID=1424756 RepID=A0ACC2X827_9TREE|nr:hypothetical protein QFC22_003105 [Naganishia vaughanmartiniae]
MPRGNRLKSALINAQHASADKAAKAKQEQARLLKHKSITGANKSQRSNKDAPRDQFGRKIAATPTTTKPVAGPPAKPISPFEADDTILLIGEGNFSYALSLLSPPHSHPAHLVLATAYDSEQVCYQKYPDAEDHVRRIREIGARVEFGVDAGKLAKSKAVGKGARWSRIVFNFPHAGAGIKDQDRNILTNQHLILSFLRSCPPLLTVGPSRFPPVSDDPAAQKRLKQGHKDRAREAAVEKWENGNGGPADEVEFDHDLEQEQTDEQTAKDDMTSAFALAHALSSGAAKDFSPPRKQGTVLITLKNSPPYTLWDIHHLATRPPILTPQQHSVPTGTIQPRYRLLRSFAFDPAFWPGYEHRRTLGFKEGVSKDGNTELREFGGSEGANGKLRTWEFAVKEEGRRR